MSRLPPARSARDSATACIALGEDGTTHQPVEQIANLRAVPRLVVIRPCDANETAYAWRVALETSDCPVALILTRQDVPTLDRSRYSAAEGLKRGAYILAEASNGQPEVILIATGSEVGLIVEAQRELEKQNIPTRLVSMPSWELFDAQAEEYRRSVFPLSIRARLAVEAGATQGWHRYVDDLSDVIGLDHFGASAPGPGTRSGGKGVTSFFDEVGNGRHLSNRRTETQHARRTAAETEIA